MFDSIDDAINFGKQKQNDGGLPFFRWESVLNKKTDEYEDVPFVMIINKGDPKSILDEPVLESHKTRWPEYWKAFMEGNEAPLEGIPLKEWPECTPAFIANCHRHHIRTVEDMSVYPDSQLKNLGGLSVSMKKKACKYLEYRQGPDVEELKQHIAEQDIRIAEQDKRTEALEKLVGNNTGNVPKRAARDGVSKPKHSGRKQQSRRKSNTANSKASSKSSS